jgi:hypothetical protein
MRFAWSRTMTLDVPLTPDQVLKRLRKRFDTDTERRPGFLERVPDILPIWLSDDGFRTEYPREGNHRGIVTVAFGTLHRVPTGTRIDVAVCISKKDRLGSGVMLGILVLVMAIHLWQDGTKRGVITVFLVGLMLMISYGRTIIYRRSAQRIIDDLHQAFDLP